MIPTQGLHQASRITSKQEQPGYRVEDNWRLDPQKHSCYNAHYEIYSKDQHYTNTIEPAATRRETSRQMQSR